MYLYVPEQVQKRADELKQLALNGSGNTDKMNHTELCYYVTMMHLYAMYRDCQIGLATAQADGQNALRTFRDESQYDELNHRGLKLWQAVEAAGAAYAHDRTRANADEFYRVVYGFKEGVSPFKDDAPEWEKDDSQDLKGE